MMGYDTDYVNECYAMILLLPPPLSEGGQYILIYHDQSNMLYVPLTPL